MRQQRYETRFQRNAPALTGLLLWLTSEASFCCVNMTGTCNTIATTVQEVVFQVWWSWESVDASVFSRCYHWFNLSEALAWTVFAALVLQRYLVHRRSRMELVYAGLFTLFAASDVCEAWQHSTWLLILKGVILLLLWQMRRYVMRVYYPEDRIF